MMFAPTRSRSLSALLSAMLALFVVVVGPSRPAQAMVTFTDWFKLGSNALKDWDVAPTPGNASSLRLKPKRLLSSQPLRRVLVLYPRKSSAYDTAMTTFVNVVMDKRINADFTVINFQLDDQRGKAALEFAESSNFDLILSMGSESTAWLWSHYRGGKLPVVTVCSKDPVLLGQSPGYDQGSGTNFAFTSLNMPIDAQMSYVLRLRPNLKNLAILVDANNVSAIQTQAVPAKEYLRARGVRVLNVAVKNPSKVREELAVQVRDAVNATLAEDQRSNFLHSSDNAEEFKASKRSLLDLLDSESSRFGTEIQVASQQYIQLFNAYRVLGAMGRILQALHVSAPTEAEATRRTRVREQGPFTLDLGPMR